jgi:geranylgeranyl diphosphate synthase type II
MGTQSPQILKPRKTRLELSINFEQELSQRVKIVDLYLEKYIHDLNLPSGEAILELRRSMSYSATNGGKRFRPVLSILVAELLGCPIDKILPFATAIEFIHTYSLVHDDLPCMDNDDIRRGKPTNHKVFGEDMALLAGDALLTEAFFLLAKAYSEDHLFLGPLVLLLSDAAGVRGMVGGQAIDLRAPETKFSVGELSHLHRLKTGALICAAIEGAALIARANPPQVSSLRAFGQGLGLAFQIADDILDHGEKDQDLRSFTGALGVDGAQAYLKDVSSDALNSLRKLSAEAPLLEYLIDYNRNRKV